MSKKMRKGCNHQYCFLHYPSGAWLCAVCLTLLWAWDTLSNSYKCNPKLEKHGDDYLVVHNSWDGRERIKQ